MTCVTSHQVVQVISFRNVAETLSSSEKPGFRCRIQSRCVGRFLIDKVCSSAKPCRSELHTMSLGIGFLRHNVREEKGHFLVGCQDVVARGSQQNQTVASSLSRYYIWTQDSSRSLFIWFLDFKGKFSLAQSLLRLLEKGGWTSVMSWKRSILARMQRK